MATLRRFYRRISGQWAVDDRGVEFAAAPQLVHSAEANKPKAILLVIIVSIAVLFASPLWQFPVLMALNAAGFKVLSLEWLVPFILGPGFILFLCTRGLGMRRALASARRALRCAQCDYPLSGLPVGNDRCTTCPECGLGWNLAPAPR